MLANPRNCEMVILAHDGCGRLKLDGRCDLELRSVDKIVDESGKNDVEERELANSNAERDGMKKKKGSTTVVVGYKMHKRLRTLPPQYVQARAIRMCHNDAGS